ncbi:MAG: hypothetical protein JWP09_121 [Candidatus Taylorbacteria bacterium]|nr:hypothetical protein [Candidatus Taylorbacteria bacterium]
MDDEKIFGPLTFTQLIYAAVGGGIIYLLQNNVKPMLADISSVVIVIIALCLIKRASPPPFDDKYINTKRNELGMEEFKKWKQRKIAMIEAQIGLRKEKGLAVDPELERVKHLIENIDK